MTCLHPVRWLLLAGSLLALAPPARADEVTLAPAADTTIYEDDELAGNGAGARLSCGGGAGAERRALVRFDVARFVPKGAKITSALLAFEVSGQPSAAGSVELHRIGGPWSEGHSLARDGLSTGPHASQGDATWRYASWPSLAWRERGGDLSSEPSARIEVQGAGTYAFGGDALIEDVQAFVDDPAAAFGWIAVASGSNASELVLCSREDETGEGPRLTVTYDPPSEPTGACCFQDGSCGLQLDAQSNSCAGEYIGTNSTCGPQACAWLTGACCGLDAAASCEERTSSECGSGFAWRGPGTRCAVERCPVVLTPFVDALPILRVARPSQAEPNEAAVYRMRAVQRTQQLHRDLPPTKVWGFADDDGEGSYPGPTLEARTGEPIRVQWSNDLRDEEGALLIAHPLPVDVCLPGASNALPRIALHLHGGHVPAGADGQPDLGLLPGQAVEHRYPNAQRAATLFYADRALGISRLNAIMGLCGFYVLRGDPAQEPALPSGEHDIALLIEDRSFNADGSFAYPTYWQGSVFGDTALVNGKVSPYLEVDRGQYRFRLLNGSTSRTYTLALSNGRAFELIGNDGGLLPVAQSVHEVTIAPGERAELVIDFEFAEPELSLVNSAPAPFPYGGAAPAVRDILKLIVRDTPGETAPISIELGEVRQLDPSEAVREREITIAPAEPDEDACRSGELLINGGRWPDLEELPQLGKTEIWRLVNRTAIAQPIHIDLAAFQVLDRQRIAMSAELTPQGAPELPQRDEAGWKDTVRVGPFEIVRVLVPFEDYAGDFAYGSTLREQADYSLARKLRTSARCGDGALVPDSEACDDGNREDGDGCSSKCTLESNAGPRPYDAGVPDDAGPNASALDDGGCSVQPGGSRSRVPWLSLLLAALALRTLHARQRRRQPRAGGARRRGCGRRRGARGLGALLLDP